MSMNSDYVTRMETQLKKWDAEVDALAAEATRAGEQARARYDLQVKALQASREAAQKTFQQIRTASDTAGAQMLAGMEGAWATMQKAFETASDGLKT
jgi:hypothetical protein